ncbi:MAG: hypothetical protein DDT26_00097 [Dehalococcoidia bacterium]|nr:hypothetical protein [Chloroflexota bacterium]
MPVVVTSQLNSFLAAGFKTVGVKERIDLPVAATSFNVDTVLPNGAIMLSAGLVIPATITAVAATHIGFGRRTVTALPNKYLLSAGLTAGSVARVLNFWATPLTALEELAIFACNSAGAASGTIGGGDGRGFVTVNFVYAIPEVL